MQDLIPYAVSVALSPMPIAALLLILLSKRAVINSILYMVGWLLGILLLVVIAMQFALASSTSGSGEIHKIINGVLGIVLIIFSLKQLKDKVKGGKKVSAPGWMKAVENFSPIMSFGVGVSLAMLNLKNTPLGIAAGVVLSKYNSNVPELLTGLVFYVLLSGATIIIPVICFILFGKKLTGTFEVIKKWLIKNNSIIMFVLFLILGIWLLSKAL